ncbi:MAG TPA: hypothetical protein VNO52_05715 [Methylomirabilota bacterium]|nr:hypothetical protein [Methylomirabilota bacterium]
MSAGAALRAAGPVVQPALEKITNGAPVRDIVFTVAGAGEDTNSFQWLFNGQPVAGPGLAGTNEASLIISNASLAHAGVYSVLISNVVETVLAGPALLAWQTNSKPDVAKPTVTVTSPSVSSLRVLSNSLNLAGSAKDGGPLLGVFVSRRGSNPVQTNGTNTWSLAVNLDPGTNLFEIFAVDRAGNFSVTNARSVFYAASNLLTLSTSGSGAVTPNYSNQSLEIGRHYTLTAVPAPGSLFSNWTGSITSTANPLTFAMESNLVLQANFVPNPFLTRAGSYQGLFYEEDAVRPERSGFFSAAVKDKGSFTASILLGGKKYGWSGQFDAGGCASNGIARPGADTLIVELKLLLDDSGTITGTVSDTVCAALLVADRTPTFTGTNTSSFAGKYTLRLPHDTNAPAAPRGDSVAAVTVDSKGVATVSATLADDTKGTQRVPLSSAGALPLYLPLYKGKGLLLGWLYLDAGDTGMNAFAGTTDWLRLAGAGPGLFASGFTNQSAADGSRYVMPVGAAVINPTNGVASFSVEAAELFANDVELGSDNKLTNLDTNALTFSLIPASGLFKGNAIEPGTGRKLTFKGAIFQGGNFGHGYFLSTNQSGVMRLE